MALIVKSVICMAIMSAPAYNYILPSAENKMQVLQTSDIKDRILFPQYIGQEDLFSDECKRLGVCTHLPNYPKEEVAKLIAQLGPEIKKYQKNTLEDSENEFQFRTDAIENSLSLCKSHTKIQPLEGLLDKNNLLHTILQGEDANGKPIQTFKTEICESGKSSKCSYVTFNPGYDGGCIQNFSFEKVLTVVKLENGTLASKPEQLKIPSHCSCVARLKNNN